METMKMNGIYGEGNVYVIKTLKDFDEVEKLKGGEEYLKKWNPNFYHNKKEFKKFIGKIWVDENDIRFLINGNPVYEKYKVIGLEDNEAWCDYYWIVQNIRTKKVKHILTNSYELSNGIKLWRKHTDIKL